MKLITLQRLKTAIAELIKKIATAFDSLDARVKKVEGDYLSKSAGGTVEHDMYVGKWENVNNHMQPMAGSENQSSLRVNGTIQCGDINASGALNVGGESKFSGRVTVGSTLDMSGQSLIAGDGTFGNTLRAKSDFITSKGLKPLNDNDSSIGNSGKYYSGAYIHNVYGNAASADKLNTDAGATNKPVYFSGGKPVVCGYEINKTVPANAVFTDTKYTLPTATDTVLGGVKVDTALNANSTNPVQNKIINAALAGKAASSHGHNAATASAAGFMSAADKSKLDGIQAKATAVSFNRSLSSGTKVGAITINGASTDIYCQTNTDTHHTAYLYVGASNTAAANAAAANGSLYLNLVENGSVRNAHKIIGSGATSVTSDSSGNITITSTDTKYSLPTASSSQLGGVKTGSNITNTNGTISISKTNVTSALGFTPTNSVATQSANGLLSSTDKKTIDTLGSTYLKLSGGTLTGTLNFKDIGAIMNSSNELQITANKNINLDQDTYISNGNSFTINGGELKLCHEDGRLPNRIFINKESGDDYENFVKFYLDEGIIFDNYVVAEGSLRVNGQLYTASGTVQKSDRNVKTDIEALELEKAWGLISGLKPSTYKMIEGTSGRTHWGLISQEVEDAMTASGLSDMDFAGFIRAEQKDGSVEYCLRYDEFVAPLIKCVQDLQMRLEAAESELRKLNDAKEAG